MTNDQVSMTDETDAAVIGNSTAAVKSSAESPSDRVDADGTKRRTPDWVFHAIWLALPAAAIGCRSAVGPGSEIRQVLGTAVFVGMLGVTLFGLFLTPTFYVVLRGLSQRFWPGKSH